MSDEGEERGYTAVSFLVEQATNGYTVTYFIDNEQVNFEVYPKRSQVVKALKSFFVEENDVEIKEAH